MTQPTTALALTPKSILELAQSETVPDVLKEYFPDEADWKGLSSVARVNAIEFLLEEMKTTVEGLPSPAFPVIKYPTSGASFWEVPNASGEPEPMKTIEAIIVFKQLVRVYYPWGQAVSKQPPTCASLDLVRPSTDITTPQDEGKGCARCQWAQWGTAKNQAGALTRGQACKQRLRVFLLRPGDPIPMLLSLPPTALKAFSQYAVQLRQSKASLLAVTTAFGLMDQSSGDGTPYKAVTLKVGSRLPFAQMQEAATIRASFEQQMLRRGIQVDEADAVDHHDDAPPAGTQQVLDGKGQVVA